MEPAGPAAAARSAAAEYERRVAHIIARQELRAGLTPAGSASVPAPAPARMPSPVSLLSALPTASAGQKRTLDRVYAKAGPTIRANLSSLGGTLEGVIRAAYSDTYLEFMGRVTRQYEAFCLAGGLAPTPMTFHKLAGFYIDYCCRRGLSPASLTKLHSVLGKVARLSHQEWSLTTQETEMMTIVFRGLGRMFKGQNAKGQAAGIYMRDLERMDGQGHQPGVTATPADEQTLLMFDLMHQSLTRAGEVADGRLRAGDVSFVYREGAPATLDACLGVRLCIRDPKTDKLSAGGQHVYLAKRADRRDVVGRLYAHMARHHLLSPSVAQAPLFAVLAADGARTATEVSYSSVLATAKSWATRIGLDPSHIGGHSFRVGGANDLFHSGASIDVVMAHGRWKSMCWFIYKRTDLSILDALRRMAPSEREIRLVAGQVAASSRGSPGPASARSGGLPTTAPGAPASPAEPAEGIEQTEARDVAELLDGFTSDARPACIFQVGDRVCKNAELSRPLLVDAPPEWEGGQWYVPTKRADPADVPWSERLFQTDLRPFVLDKRAAKAPARFVS